MSQYSLEMDYGLKSDSSLPGLAFQPFNSVTTLPSCVKSRNPIDQLNVVMMQKGQNVQFSFCSHGKGFWCCAVAMNKSSLGKCNVVGKCLQVFSLCRFGNLCKMALLIPVYFKQTSQGERT